MELGDDPRQFQRLLKSLVEARRPVGALEMALVEDIALLLCKKARLDRSELAVQVSNLHHHDLERDKLFIKVGHLQQRRGGVRGAGKGPAPLPGLAREVRAGAGLSDQPYGHDR